MLRVLLMWFACAGLTGCISAPYELGTGRIEHDMKLSPPMKQQIYVGKPHRFLDASDWIWPESLLSKLLLWDASIDSHQISPETIAALEKYISDNELTNLQVLVNDYKPGNQWIRLFKNRTVGAGWRYTLGVFSVAFYTILPGRFFGGDAYNPYTNTLYLYSDNIGVALHEGGHAKDFGRRHFKGTNAALYTLPFVALYYEAIASSDALSYMHENRDSEMLSDAYKILYPAYGTYLGSSFGQYAGDPFAVQLAVVIPAHIVGRVMAATAPEYGQTVAVTATDCRPFS